MEVHEVPRMSKSEVVVKKTRVHHPAHKDGMLHPVGSVKIQKLNDIGEVLDEQEFKNLLVSNFYVQTARLFAGTGVTDRSIAKIAFGVNGTVEAATDTAITPPSGGNVLVDVSVEYPTTNSVKFTGVLDMASGVGVEFKEIGLLFNNTAPALAARKAFKGMTKENWIVFRVIWTITYV